MSDTACRVVDGPRLTPADLHPGSEWLTPAEKADGWRFIGCAGDKRHIERPEGAMVRLRAMGDRLHCAEALVSVAAKEDACFDLVATIFDDLDRQIDDLVRPGEAA